MPEPPAGNHAREVGQARDDLPANRERSPANPVGSKLLPGICERVPNAIDDECHDNQTKSEFPAA